MKKADLSGRWKNNKHLKNKVSWFVIGDVNKLIEKEIDCKASFSLKNDVYDLLFENGKYFFTRLKHIRVNKACFLK